MIELDGVAAFFSAGLSNQVVQFGLAFSLAYFIHEAKTKKERETLVGKITASIDHLAETVQYRLDNIEIDVRILKKIVIVDRQEAND